jgi:hypothetical protein
MFRWREKLWFGLGKGSRLACVLPHVILLPDASRTMLPAPACPCVLMPSPPTAPPGQLLPRGDRGKTNRLWGFSDGGRIIVLWRSYACRCGLPTSRFQATLTLGERLGRQSRL